MGVATEYLEDETAESGLWTVRVRDTDRPELGGAVFHYTGRQPYSLSMVQFTIETAEMAALRAAPPGRRGEGFLWSKDLGALTLTRMRDFPLATWERSARARAAMAVEEDAAAWNRALDLTWDEAIWRDVFSARPELQGIDREDRRARAAFRLAEAAQLYRQALMVGSDAPAAEVAHAKGVKPATARAWLHRARKEGFLGPATGPTAGEGTHVDEGMDR